MGRDAPGLPKGTRESWAQHVYDARATPWRQGCTHALLGPTHPLHADNGGKEGLLVACFEAKHGAPSSVISSSLYKAPLELGE